MAKGNLFGLSFKGLFLHVFLFFLQRKPFLPHVLEETGNGMKNEKKIMPFSIQKKQESLLELAFLSQGSEGSQCLTRNITS